MKLPVLSKNIGALISGTEIGIPLNIISKISTDVNFQNTPLTKESILFNFLLGFSTYKQDRYLDSLEYYNKYKYQRNESNFNLTNPKHNYYLSLIHNEKQIQLSLFICYISICIFTIYYHLGIIIPFFSSTFLYKYCKNNKNVSFLKPFYVAGMWTFCTCVIPLLLSDSFDYSMVSFQLLSPTFLNLFALTNLADLKDYDEDLLNEINTLPIILGKSKIKIITLACSIISMLMFINSDYYSSNIQNLFYISSNVFPYLSFLNSTSNDIPSYI